jgi:predicted nucleic acid-binding protein
MELEPLTHVFIDTAVIIYYIEGNQKYEKYTQFLFDLIDDEKTTMVVSSTVLSECLVLPFRKQEDNLVATYLELLLYSDRVTLIDIDSEVALKIAKLRADNRSLKYPDASNIAAAMHARCNYFITNDEKLLKLQGLNQLKVILLEDVEQNLNDV